MEQMIGVYKPLGSMDTTGSGTSRWCFAERNGERFFLKQFLSPVYPPERLLETMRERTAACVRFENRKKNLYTALSRVPGQFCVPVTDFFRCGGHYYSVSPVLPEEAVPIAPLGKNRGRALANAARGLRCLHRQGLVHGDLKPEHVYVLPPSDQIRLIDFDSGFFAGSPSRAGEGTDGDPAWMAPETFLRMAGKDVPVGTEADIFSFGLMVHYVLCGRMPRISSVYASEDVLSGHIPEMDEGIPSYVAQLIKRMLSLKASDRPDDDEIVFTLEMEYL